MIGATPVPRVVCFCGAFALLVGVGPTLAGVWPSDLRLDTDPAGQNSSCLPQLAGTNTEDGHLYAVWQDYRGPRWQIYFRGSSDWGRTWPLPDVPISQWGNAERPQIVADPAGNVYVAWLAFENGEERICFNRSPNAGATWLASEITLNAHRASVAEPTICCDARGHVYVAWAEYDGQTEQVFFNASADAGSTWLAAPIRINTNPPGESWSETPQLACDDDGDVYLAYVDDGRTGGGYRHVYFRRSQNHGVTWDPTEIRLDTGLDGAGWLDLVAGPTGEVHVAWAVNNASLWSNGSADSGATWLAAPVQVNGAGGTQAGLIDLHFGGAGALYATYMDNRSGTIDVYANVSTDGGISWSRESVIATGVPDLFNIMYPQITSDGGHAYVVWMDPRNGYFDIYIRETPDAGLTWVPEEKVNTSPDGIARSAYPRILAANGQAAVIWDDRRAGEGAPDTYFNVYTSLYGNGLQPAPLPARWRTDAKSISPPALVGGLAIGLLITAVAGLMRHRWLAMLLAAALVGAGAAQAQVLENDLVRFDFHENGTQLDLTSITNKRIGLPIDLQPGSGRWDIVLRDRTAYDNTLTISSDGSGATTLSLESVVGSPTEWSAHWAGTAAFLGTTIGFDVYTHWTLNPTAPMADTTIRVAFTPPPGEVPFYMSHILYPHLHVPQIDATDQLLAPVLCGYLHENPITNGPVWSVLSIDFEWSALSVPLLAYYGTTTGRCLYFTDNDPSYWWKVLCVQDNPDENRLEFCMRHVPDDVFTNLDFTTPYGARIGALQGDWVDVAETYRAFLATGCDWYKGPVGAPSNPMPEPVKRLVAHAQYGTNYPGDSLDIMARDIMRLTRVFGEGVYTRWYGCHWPDEFSAFYNRGYLPGRPTFAAAIRESEKQFHQISAPYIQGTAAYDYSVDPDFTGDPTQMNLDIHASAVIFEDGTRWAPLGISGLNAMMCNGGTPWDEIFVQNIVDITDFTSMHGAYLDYFGSFICYSQTHGHRPGGGTYPYDGRIEQLQVLKDRLAYLPNPPAYFGLCMETVHGRYSEEIPLMFTNPLHVKDADEDTPRTVVPFFRLVHDNVKISRVMGTASASLDPGYSSWAVANNVLTFGQIIGIGSTVQEAIPTFHYRPLVPYYRFMTKICQFLRDRDFFRWHNGTMARLPAFTVTNAAGFPGEPGPPAGNMPLFIEEVLTPGMFRGLDGTLAFVVANPWVGADQRDFEFTATFRPGDYADFGSTYTVVKVNDNGIATFLGTFTGDHTIEDTVNTGEIVYWIFDGRDGNGEGAPGVDQGFDARGKKPTTSADSSRP